MTVRVRVAADEVLTTIGPGALGVCAQFWNPHTVDPRVAPLLRAAGVQLLDWDAGMPVDLYDWRTNTLRPDPGAADHPWDYGATLQPRFDFDQFLALARQAQIREAMVHVNYGTGTPEEAAEWVRHANLLRGFRVGYWEIGESLHFNGCLPGKENIEPDGHADRSPEAYGRNALEFLRRMKAVDPTIRVGVGLSSRFRDPALWSWNERVLRIAGRELDFVDVFVFGSGWPLLTDAELLARPRTNADVLARVRALVDAHARPGVELIIGEATSVANAGAQQIGIVSALFLADHVLSLLAGGAAQVHWYSICGALQGDRARGYGDMGLLSSGERATGSLFAEPSDYCQPPPTTPFPAYYALKLLQHLVVPGARLVRAESEDPAVVVHASRRSDQRVAVLLLNEDSTGGREVVLPFAGTAAGFRYAEGFDDVEPFTIRLEPGAPLPLRPSSLTVLLFERA